MRFRFIKTSYPGDFETAYDVYHLTDDVKLGSVRQHRSSTAQFGAHLEWRIYLPDGTRLANTRPTRQWAAELLVEQRG